MTKKIILITGCQRSGTTLVRLILDSHPDILTLDEDKFDYADINTYLNAPWLSDLQAFKLPRYSPLIDFIKSLPDVRVLWCIRDPLDVVWSMLNLQVYLNPDTRVPWSAHPACAQADIRNCYWPLPESTREVLKGYMHEYRDITRTAPYERSRHDMILFGALCWRLKNELLDTYKTERISYHCIKYEDLVTNPKVILQNALKYIGAGWHDDVLKHHNLHNGVSIGETSNTRPIDKKSIGHGAGNLTRDETMLIADICNPIANSMGYTIL